MLSTSTAVITAVATKEGVEPGSLPPLYDVIDCDALDALYRGRDASDVPTVGFRYNSYYVTVSGPDHIEIEEIET